MKAEAGKKKEMTGHKLRKHKTMEPGRLSLLLQEKYTKEQERIKEGLSLSVSFPSFLHCFRPSGEK